MGNLTSPTGTASWRRVLAVASTMVLSGVLPTRAAEEVSISVGLREPVLPRRLGTFHELDSACRHTDVSGKLEITVSRPFIISSSLANPAWGRHEQPHLFKMPCGDIHLAFHKDGDIHGAERVVLRSGDGGKNWAPLTLPVHRHEAVGCLRNGTVLVYDDYAFRKAGNVFAGQMCVSRDGGKTFGPLELALFHKPGNTAAGAAGAYWNAKALGHYKTSSAKWSDQLCHALWRSVLENPDGTLIACAHSRYQGDTKLRTICYHSKDGGRTWENESTVAYDPKIAGEGFVEPVMSFCSNGDVLCVMRTGGYLPLVQSRSSDGGKTWEKPTQTGSLGVDPDLCLMRSGVLACSYGRPGNRIMFSADGTGRPGRLGPSRGSDSKYSVSWSGRDARLHFRDLPAGCSVGVVGLLFQTRPGDADRDRRDLAVVISELALVVLRLPEEMLAVDVAVEYPLPGVSP